MTLRTVLLAGAAVALLASAGCHKKPAPDAAASDSSAAASDSAASMTAASDAAMAPASK